jgi:lambda repressor-like predicted transcriptional regulator
LALLLAEKGIRTYSQAASLLGVSLQHLSTILACREKNPRMQKAVAKLCGKTPKEIFGEFTHPDLLDPAARAGVRASDRSRNEQKESA